MPDIRQAVLDEMARRGWSAMELSRQAKGVSYRHVYGWLRGDRGIGLTRLEPILEALELEIDRKGNTKESTQDNRSTRMKLLSDYTFTLEQSDEPVVTRQSRGEVALHDSGRDCAYTIRFKPCQVHIRALRECLRVLESTLAERECTAKKDHDDS
jgi:hypothetical protein